MSVKFWEFVELSSLFPLDISLYSLNLVSYGYRGNIIFWSFQLCWCIFAFNTAFYQKLEKCERFFSHFPANYSAFTAFIESVIFFWYCRHQLLPQISQLLSGVEGIPDIWRQTGRPCIPRLVCSLRQVILCHEPTTP